MFKVVGKTDNQPGKEIFCKDRLNKSPPAGGHSYLPGGQNLSGQGRQVTGFVRVIMDHPGRKCFGKRLFRFAKNSPSAKGDPSFYI